MKIAVIGGGVSGLVAAMELAPRHDVRLFEAASHLGGHTLTTLVEEEDCELAIDMGFIVFNERTYPELTRLLARHGVASEPSSMSFSVRCEKTGLEYNGTTINQLFAQRRNALRPSFYRMIFDILRFHKVAPRALETEAETTINEFLAAYGFAGPFVDHYLVPMTAAIWSTAPPQIGEFPVRTLVRFLHNHGMLTVDDRPLWRVIRGGSHKYVEAFSRGLRGRVELATPIERVARLAEGVEVKPHGGVASLYDRVVIATHSDQALGLLADPTATEQAVLGAVPYAENEAVLHTDESLLPRRRLAWASWNSHLLGVEDGDAVRLTYYMNKLQNLDAKRHYCVTLNRTADIAPERILKRVMFAHPQFTCQAVAARQRWAELSSDATLYCGAYWGYGFHEDGVKSALRAVATIDEGAIPAAARKLA